MCSHNMFLSLFVMNQTYGCLRCLKTCYRSNKSDCFSCSEHRNIFSLKQVKKSVASVVFTLSRDVLVLKKFLTRLMFNCRIFWRRVTTRWWRQWAKNQVSTNENSRKRWCQIVIEIYVKQSWKRVRSNGLNNVDLCDRSIREDKTDSMLWLNFNKILKTLIWHQNMLTFMEDTTSKVRIFL